MKTTAKGQTGIARPSGRSSDRSPRVLRQLLALLAALAAVAAFAPSALALTGHKLARVFEGTGKCALTEPGT